MRAALLVAHDEVARRAVRRAELLLEGTSDTLVRVQRPDDDPAMLVELLREDLYPLPARSSYPIVHVVGEPDRTEDVAALDPKLLEVAGRVRERFPGLVVREWFVLETGQRLDEHEEALAAEIHRRLPECHGAFLTASSTEASVAHDAREQSAFTGDLLTLLAVGALDDFPPGGTWVVGAASVAYRANDLRRALTALQLAALVDERLLAPVTPDDTDRQQGRDRVVDLRLAGDEDLQRLLRAPEGGSVLDRLRLPDGVLEGTPLRFWVDDLASLHDEWVATELRRANLQIDRRLAVRIEELEADLEGVILGRLRERANVPRAVEYVHGIDEELESIERSLSRQERPDPAAAGEAMVAAEEQLRSKIARLPFAPAILLRASVIVLLVGLLSEALLGPLLGEPLGRWAAVLATAIAVVWSWIRYARTRAQVLAARDRLVAVIETRLDLLAHAHAQEALSRLVRQLRRWVDGPDDGVVVELQATHAQLRASVDELTVLGETRAPEELVATPFARSLPSVEDLTSSRLLERFRPEPSVMEALPYVATELFASDWRVDRARVDGVLRSLVGATSYRGLWRDLPQLLEDSPVTRRTAVETLSQPTVPVITDADRRPGPTEPRRRVHLRRADLHRLSELVSEEAGDDGLAELGPAASSATTIDPVVRYLDAVDVGIAICAVPLHALEVH